MGGIHDQCMQASCVQSWLLSNLTRGSLSLEFFVRSAAVRYVGTFHILKKQNVDKIVEHILKKITFTLRSAPFAT